jgi:cell division septation protein DedD
MPSNHRNKAIVLNASNQVLQAGDTSGITLVHGLVFSNTTGASATVTLQQVISGTTFTLAVLTLAAGATFPWPKTINIADSLSDQLQATCSPASAITATVAAYLDTAAQASSGFSARGPWVSGTTYSKNDVVTSSSKNWICRVDSVTNTTAPSEGATWAEFIQANSPVTITFGNGLTSAVIGNTSGSSSSSGTIAIDTAVVVDKTTAQTVTNKTLALAQFSPVSVTNGTDWTLGVTPGRTIAGQGILGTAVGTGNNGTQNSYYVLPPLPSTFSDPNTFAFSSYLVTEDNVQTLKNKTLLSPGLTAAALSSPVVTGTMSVSGTLASTGDVTLTTYAEKFFTNATGITTGNPYTIVLTNGSIQKVTLSTTGSLVLPNPSGNGGRSITILVGMAGGTLTWAVTGGSAVKWGSNNTAPTASTSNATTPPIDMYCWLCDGTSWFGVLAEKAFL